jgi:hypothetical protein
MIAYFVHNKKDQTDTIVLTEFRCSVSVDAKRLREFISANPSFKGWSGDACGQLSPEDYGTIVATRDDCGDVNVINESLWHDRMNHYLGIGR